MSAKTKKSSFLGAIAGACMILSRRYKAKPGADDLKQAEFKTSTQHMGIRFTDKIRNVFRFRWIK